MQGVHRVIQSLSLFDVVSGYVKQLPCPSASAVSACSMRPGSLVLSTSKSAALYNSLHALLSKDLELPVFIIPPVSHQWCITGSSRQRLSLLCRSLRSALDSAFVCWRLFSGYRRWTLAVLSPEGSEQHRLVNQLDTMAPVISTGKRLVFAIEVKLGTSFIDNQRAPAVD